MPRCDAIRKDGEQCACTFGINPRNGKCFQHDPTRGAARRLARSRGGVSTALQRQRVASESEAPPRPESAADAKTYSAWLLHAAVTGAIDKATANVGRGILQCFLTALDKAETEARLADVEAKLAKLEKRRG